MANGRKRTKSPVSRPRVRRSEAPPPEAEAAEPEAEAEPAVEPEALEPQPEELAEVDAEVEGSGGPVVPTAALVPAGDAGLARRDPLQAYMAEVTRHPLLTREEEHELAKKYQQTGDVQAAYRLVASNLRLVVKLAHEYHRNPLSLLDLIQEGNIGLMQAVKKYDPDRGVKLSSYAAWWIRAYILRYIMDNWKMVKLGTTEAQRKLFFKLRQEQDKLMAQGFEPNPKLLAERLNVTEQDVVEMDQRLGNEQLKELFREKLTEFAKSLEGKELFIFENRLTADEPLTLQDIGDKYGVSRERARQIEAALINRMREYMREQIPDFDMVAVPKG